MAVDLPDWEAIRTFVKTNLNVLTPFETVLEMFGGVTS